MDMLRTDRKMNPLQKPSIVPEDVRAQMFFNRFQDIFNSAYDEQVDELGRPRDGTGSLPGGIHTSAELMRRLRIFY
ncbi:hypothetical protein WICPIJ_004889 [Wickerhamomyces pijperi]|uniref:Uncharacterized protein n=1 Tax=Wickerhamomyces pijperi TaxID=599730 RepID=A0A9P8Q776_WICPI|nr:hypothetical protein WICPIJ_004889 [Wickerhamomyces pijperi]